MAKPVILTVDDDAEVLQAIARDLRQQYGARFRIIRADSGQSAIDTVHQLKLRNEPGCSVSGRSANAIDVRRRVSRTSTKSFPTAKRALLTAYADTDAAIRAINSTQIDYYLLKRGTHQKNGCIRFLTICSMTGSPLSARV